MKSTEFLTEDALSKVKAASRKIKKECQPYLQQVADPFEHGVFRGVITTAPVIHRKVKLNNRTPMNSSPFLHKLMNKSFEAKFGQEYRHALFVSGSEKQVWDYGESYITFPVGEFTFLWSPTVYDAYYAFQKWEEKYRNKYENTKDLEQDFAKYLMKKGDYRTTDLKSAIASGHEIMIRCNKYYGIYYELDPQILSTAKEIILS